MSRRSAHPTVPRRGPRPTRVPKHHFRADPDVPADFNGRKYCATCQCHGEAGDARHHTDDETAQRAADQRQLDQRRLGERSD